MINKSLVKLNKHLEEVGAPYFAVGLYEIINYILIFPWWYITYHNFKISGLPHIIIFLSMAFPLVFHKYWSHKIIQYKALYFYICIFFMFPYLALYYFLAAPNNLLSILDVMLALFVLILIIDWMSFIILWLLAIPLAIIGNIIVFGQLTINPNHLLQAVFTFAWTILAGAFFSRNAHRQRKNTQLEKQLGAIKTVVASMAHELRTPLLSIRSGAAGIKTYVPKLLEAYQAAEKANLKIPKVYDSEIKHILRVMDNIDSEVNYSNTVIDTLLTNANKNIINPDVFNSQSMLSCINAAMIRFPFNPKEQINLVHIDQENNFKFHGDDLLMVHILFNLLKNAFYAIAETNKGEIFIRMEHGEKCNRLYVKDTAKGINSDTKEKLFTTFYSNTPNNTGIGLAYCRLAMESFDAKISVDSVLGEYTEFTLEFPILTE
jgi:signal transduction histidine kinase